MSFDKLHAKERGAHAANLENYHGRRRGDPGPAFASAEVAKRNDAIRAQLDAELFARLTERERHEP